MKITTKQQQKINSARHFFNTLAKGIQVREVEVKKSFDEDTDIYVTLITFIPEFENLGVFDNCYQFFIGKSGGMFTYSKTTKGEYYKRYLKNFYDVMNICQTY